MNKLTFIIMSPWREFDSALEESGFIDVLAHVERADELAAAIEKKRPDAMLVSLAEDPDAVFAALEKILTPRPMLFCYGPDDSQLILQSMRVGACEYIAPTADEKQQLLAAVERLAHQNATPSRTQQAPLLAVTGAKGGVGSSFLACQLGASLAHLGAQPVVVDGQFRLGDVALYMDLAPDYTFASLANREESIDPTYLHSTLAKHDCGVRVLAAPSQPEDADSIGVDCVEGTIRILRNEFDWVIWDTPRDFDDRSLHVLDHADRILLVTTADVPAMNHTRMQLELLERLGRSREEIRIVLNRTDQSGSVSDKAAREFLGRTVDFRIPNDYKRASKCVNEGRTVNDIAPRSALAQALSEFAMQIHDWCDQPLPESHSSGSGMFARLLGR